MSIRTGRSNPEPFGKRNRRTVKEPMLAKSRKSKPSAVPQNNTRLHLYLAGGVVFLLLAGYALAL
jgi:hypothetical protein